MTRLIHSSLAVSDLERSIDFYCRAFDAEVVLADSDMTDLIDRTVGIRGVRAGLAQLRFPGSDHLIELIAFRDVPERLLDQAPMRVGHGHICFAVDDLEQKIARTERLGAVPIGEVVSFPGECRAIYMREPAGSVFELEEPIE